MTDGGEEQVDHLEQVARDEEEDGKEEDVGDHDDDSLGHRPERIENVFDQAVPGAPGPGEETEHVLQVHKPDDDDGEHASPVERSPQRPPDLLGAHDLERLDADRLHAPVIARLQRRLRPPPEPDDQRDERRQDRGRAHAAQRAAEQRLPAARLTVVHHGRANGAHEELREHLALHGFQPGIGVHHQHHPVAVGDDRGTELDLDRMHRVGRHGRIGGERRDPLRDARSASVRGKRRRPAHAEQHVAVDHHRSRRQLGLQLGALRRALLGSTRFDGERRRLEGERCREQRDDCRRSPASPLGRPGRWTRHGPQA